MGNSIPSSDQTPYEVIATLVLDTLIILFVWAIVARFLGYSDPSAPTVFSKQDSTDEDFGREIPTTSDTLELIQHDSAQQDADDMNSRSMSIDRVAESESGDQDYAESVTSKESQYEPIANMTIRKLSSNALDEDTQRDSRQRKAPPPKKKLAPSRSSRFTTDNAAESNTSASGKASKFELSQEERGMNGAPEGELYVTNARAREDLSPFEYDGDNNSSEAAQSFAKALVVLSDANLKGVAWNLLFDAISTVRIVLIYHRNNQGMHFDEALPLAVPAIVFAAKNSRSVLAKNGLYCISDYFFACQEMGSSVTDTLLIEPILDSFVDILIESMASNKAATLRLAAEAALDQMVDEESDVRVLVSLVPLLAQRGRHRSSVCAEQAYIFVTKALKAALNHDEELVHSLLLSNANFIKDLSNGLNGRSVTAKKQAKECCILLLDTFGKEDWVQAVSIPDLSARKIEELCEVDKVVVSAPNPPPRSRMLTERVGSSSREERLSRNSFSSKQQSEDVLLTEDSLAFSPEDMKHLTQVEHRQSSVRSSIAKRHSKQKTEDI